MVIRRVAAVVSAAVVIAGAGLGAAQASQSPSATGYSWKITPTGSTDEFRGLAAVSAQVAWVSGEAGTILRTTDGGSTWTDVSPADAAGRALRDIEATDSMHAVALAIGKGKHSRIYSTDDGGQTWDIAFMNHNTSAFFDCMAFSTDGTGLAMSDPVDGHFRLVRSTDDGHSWKLLVPQTMPKALKVEFGFAASGTCLISGPGHQFWIASGGTHPRVFHTSDAGENWTVARTPIRGGASAGIYSIAFDGSKTGVAVGGDYTLPNDGKKAAATSADGGKTWTLSSSPVSGYRSGVAYVPGVKHTVVAVGPNGSDVSTDGGDTWSSFDSDWYDGVECASDGACWGSGTDGRVAVLQH
jgi:photosystem II stability/assembly factor-like uncharacterized protein